MVQHCFFLFHSTFPSPLFLSLFLLVQVRFDIVNYESLPWVSGVSGEKGKDESEKGREAGIWGFPILRVHLSFKLRGLENTILARVLFLFQERTWKRPLEPLWIPLSVRMKSKHLWKISMASPCRSLCSYLLAVGDVRGYCVLSNHCHIQILDVSHDLLNGFVSGLPFSPPPPPPPSKISSPSAP